MKMKTDVIQRLATFGNIATPEDDFALGFLIDKVVNHVRTFCHIPACKEIPKELHQVMIDMVVGEFLQAKKAQGDLDLDVLAENAAIKQIKIGDTSVESADEQSFSTQLDKIFAKMAAGSTSSSLVSFRRMRW
ncbi:MAG: TOP6B-like family protein [Clostridiales bacterium]|nr:TOP6B-like family protein [Clostridiales bacterium]